MEIISKIFRYFTGLLFIFSGLIKLNDPVGTQIKLEEYFEVFSHDISPFFLNFIPAALFISVVLSVLEVVLGIALLIKFKMKQTLWVLLLMIVFFTFLTFYSAYFNKVTDCGCFGDAIKLTPWQSFSKDIILLIMIVFLFLRRNKFSEGTSPAIGWTTIGVSTALSVGIAVFAIRHLPPVNFRAYKIGKSIPEQMKPSEPLKFQYIMVKGEDEKVFDVYPTDTTWKFKSMETVNPEAMPKITDYRIWNDEGDFTEETFKGNKLLIIITNIAKTDIESYKKINELTSNLASANAGVEPLVITSADRAAFEQFRHEVQLAVPFYYADATVLKTIMRSNPGLMLMQNGTIKGLWHYNDIPTADEVNNKLK